MTRVFKNIRIVAPGDREKSLPERYGVAKFGITEAIAGAISGFLATDLGVGAATSGILGSAGAGALEGGAIGALTNLKNPLKGAEFGAISGGVAGLAAPAVADLGLGATATGGISGALGGAAGSLATGRNPVTGALMGGLGGAATGAFAPGTASPTGGTATTGGPLGSAVSTAAPASVGVAPSGPSDVTITPEGAGGTTPGGFMSGGAAPSGVSVTPEGAGGSVPGGTVGSGGGAAVPVDASGGGMSGWLKNNRDLIGMGGLALDAIKGNQALPGQKQLQASAAQLAQQGAQLQSYERSGTLPPGLEMGLKQATEAAQASIRSQYASAGMSGSSAEAQDLAAVQERASVQGAQLAIQLLQQGVSETNMADQLYLELMGQALQQDQALGQAVASFASGMVPAAPTTKTG